MLRALSDCRYMAFLMVPWLTLLVVAQCPPVGLPVTTVLRTGPGSHVILVQNTSPCAFTRLHVVFAVPVDKLTARALRPLPYHVYPSTPGSYFVLIQNTDPFRHDTFVLPSPGSDLAMQHSWGSGSGCLQDLASQLTPLVERRGCARREEGTRICLPRRR